MWGFRPTYTPSSFIHHGGFGPFPTMSVQSAQIPYSNGGLPGFYQSGGSNGYGHSQSGFAFKKRFERVDWKKIASADVEAISRNLDFNALQDNIMNVTFCNIETEIDTRMVDPNLTKLFKLAQLTIEYLLHSQDYLTSLVGALEIKLKKAVDEHEETKKSLNKNKDQLTEVKKESHKRKKMLTAQQQIIQAGVNSYNKCQFCAKAFVNATFLQSHLQRRHADSLGSYNAMVASQTQHPQPVIVEPAPASAPAPQPQVIQSQPIDNTNAELEKQLTEIKDRLQLTESQLVDERNARNSLVQKEKRDEDLRERQIQNKMRRWQEEQEQQNKKQMDHLQEAMMRELNEMNEKYQASQRMLEEMQRKQGRQSNLGSMQDDLDSQRELLEKQREEAAILKEQLQQQVNSAMETRVMQLENDEEDDDIDSQQQQQELQQMLQQSEENQREQELLREQEQERQRALQEQERQRALQEQQRAAEAEQKTTVQSGVGAMYDDSEEETEQTPDHRDQEEEGETTEFDGTSTFTTTRGTLSMGQFDAGTLSMTEPPSERLMLEMKKNPNLLKVLKEELRGILTQALKNRGIPETAQGVSDAVCESKLQLLKNERQQTAQRYRNIYDIRQQYLNTVEQQARDILRAREKQNAARSANAAPARPASAPMPRKTPTAPPTSTSQGKQTPGAPSHSPPPYRQPQSIIKQHPVPAPRSTSPTGRPGSGGWGGQVRSSVGSSMATTTASSTWDDDDDDEDDDITDDPDYRQAVRSPESPSKPVKATRFADEEEDEDESDSNWDDLSDMDTMEPTLPGHQSRSKIPAPKMSTPQPKGQKVAELSRSIELQLSGRGKKPVGGVSMVSNDDAPGTSKQRTSHDDEDDSFPSVSSVEDEKMAGPRAPRRQATPVTRSSAADTEYSTNTYGTSLWGSASRAGSTAHQGNTAHNTTAKTSTDSDVWDSDELTED